jgi:DNA (cytosine-5)-methyltransferase 1
MDGYWVTEPDIPRTAKGIRNRVARLRALGNAVVPAQAYPIFKAIADIEIEGWDT